MAATADTGVAGAFRLQPQAHAKPWGCTALGPWGLGLDDRADDAIGEIHHVADGIDDPELLIKTLFTSERLSVQVHPDAIAARARGHRRGKDEAWVVLAAEPGASIGIGLTATSDAERLRAAALDGSIAEMLAWHDCAPGDVFFTPSGTIHAIGGGVTLFEVQQNLDVTYRLFDYGRGRELHLEDGLAVAHAGPWRRGGALPSPGPGRELLVEGPGFVLERLRLDGRGTLRAPVGQPLWLAVVEGAGEIDGAAFAAGEVWTTMRTAELAGAGELLLAYPGAAAADVWEPGR
jgi:mannose-6-phosphate isomerase